MDFGSCSYLFQLETLRLIFNHLELRSPTRKEMFFEEEGTDQHKREAIQKLEAYNADVIFKYGESVSGSLQKPLQ
jgi:hypothetical protein